MWIARAGPPVGAAAVCGGSFDVRSFIGSAVRIDLGWLSGSLKGVVAGRTGHCPDKN